MSALSQRRHVRCNSPFRKGAKSGLPRFTRSVRRRAVGGEKVRQVPSAAAATKRHSGGLTIRSGYLITEEYHLHDTPYSSRTFTLTVTLAALPADAEASIFLQQLSGVPWRWFQTAV